MATIKCPQCGAEVSNKAVACNKCAYPSKNFLPIHCATFNFFEVGRSGIVRDCFIYDRNFNRLAACDLGSSAAFICCEEKEVFVQMVGCMCKPSIKAKAGGKYNIRLIRFGLISVEEIT